MRSAPAITRTDRRLVLVFFLGSLVFLSTIGLAPYPGSWAVKTLPIASLALFAFRNFPGRAGRAVGFGFVFSGAGDILLELPRTPLLFQAGMGAFILAHLCYFSHFIRRPAWGAARGIFMGIITAACVSYGVFLLPRLGPMALPILVYFAVILAMALATALGRDNHPVSMAGAAVFILSDGLIACNMFITPVPASDFWIMLTYYAAQALLAAGVWLGLERKQASGAKAGKPA